MKKQETVLKLLLSIVLVFCVLGFGYCLGLNMKQSELEQQLVEQQEYYEELLQDYQQELLDAQNDIEYFQRRYEDVDDVNDFLEWLLYTNQELLSLGAYIDIDGDIHYENGIIGEYVSKDMVEQIVSDFEHALNITIEYYEETDQSQTLDSYVQENYPELYNRIMTYEEWYWGER